jgi:hypothetical protein
MACLRRGRPGWSLAFGTLLDARKSRTSVGRRGPSAMFSHPRHGRREVASDEHDPNVPRVRAKVPRRQTRARARAARAPLAQARLPQVRRRRRAHRRLAHGERVRRAQVPGSGLGLRRASPSRARRANTRRATRSRRARPLLPAAAHAVTKPKPSDAQAGSEYAAGFTAGLAAALATMERREP